MKDSNNIIYKLPIDKNKFDNINKIIDTFSMDQIYWLSGYLLGLSKNNDVKKYLIRTNKNITILSSSQTGNARSIAKKLYNQMILTNLEVNLFKTSDYKFKNIDQENILIIVTSTYGEGEPPEESYMFYKFLMSQKAPKLNNLFFAVFGLGDSSYKFFNKSAKDFDSRLQALGAKRLIERVDADIEYSKLVNEWILKILNILKKSNNIENKLFVRNKILNKNNYQVYSKENPLKTNILCNQKITGKYSNKDVRHIEINLSDLNLFYKPGDALGIWYKNDPLLVKEIISLFKLSNNNVVNINNKKLLLYNALLEHCEITINTMNIVKKYSLISNNKDLISISNNLLILQNFVKNTPLISMFTIYKSKLTAHQLISLLRPLTPRFYSISSSQKENNKEVHITVKVLKYTCNNRIHFGGASNYLSRRVKDNDKIEIFLQKNNNFRLPVNSKIPIIMIATGTGIAPFRSFIQERENIHAIGKNWLFFGDQKFTEDFLYQVEWISYFKKGLLNKISLAWSQDQKYKIYVQDKIIENKKNFWKWIKDGAYIYICGSIKMFKYVELSILKIIQEYNKMNKSDSMNFLNELKINHRYQKDVY